MLHGNMRIEVEREDDGRWLGEIPELPGVAAYGQTEAEAVAKVKALALRVLADRLQHGEDRGAAVGMRTVGADMYKPTGPDPWKTCLQILGRPIETLDSIQRPAALVFEYYGRVMNGGHSLHFDVHGDSEDRELVQALHELGAVRHARILREAYFLRREAKRIKGEEDYADESIEDLDLKFGRLNPDIPELLARYFKAHPESFPT
jgi:predicted RNase H-like HicB family nuclease